MSDGGRPRFVPAVAAFLFAAAVIAVIVGVSLVFPNPLMDRLWPLNRPAEAAFRALGTKASAGLLLLGAGTAACGAGFLYRQKWAWWFAVVLFAVNCVGDLLDMVLRHDWLRGVLGAAVSSLFLYWLLRHRIRNYCLHSE